MNGPQRYLVVGLKELNAGKTTIARALLRCLRDRGMRACGFKPKAGNTLWYDYDVVHEALRQGRLYGKDAKRLKEASSTALPEELVNPIHRLWATPPHHLTPDLASLPYFIVDRVTFWGEQPSELVVVNDALPFKHGREGLVANLYKPGTEVEHVTTCRTMNMIVDRSYEEAIERAHRRIAEEHDAVIYESYADIALPWRGITDLDVVLAVHPGYIHAYDPDRYLSALHLYSRMLREKRTENVVDMLKPIKTVRVPPYRSEVVVPTVMKKLRQLLKPQGSV
jgi:predicted P-loop ATPase/GTPase